MFARLFAVASLAALVVAGPLVARDGQCNTGSIQCCTSTQKASSVSGLFGEGGLLTEVTSVTGLVGFNCSPITGIGASSGAMCQQAPMCCENNYQNGLINVGCVPITAPL